MPGLISVVPENQFWWRSLKQVGIIDFTDNDSRIETEILDSIVLEMGLQDMFRNMKQRDQTVAPVGYMLGILVWGYHGWFIMYLIMHSWSYQSKVKNHDSGFNQA